MAPLAQTALAFPFNLTVPNYRKFFKLIMVFEASMGQVTNVLLREPDLGLPSNKDLGLGDLEEITEQIRATRIGLGAGELSFVSEGHTYPDHTRSDLLSRRASIRISRGEYPLAKQDLEHSLRLNPDNALAHNNLGFVLRYDEDYEMAAEHFQIATEIGGVPMAPYSLAQMKEREGSVEEAEALYLRAAEMSGYRVAAFSYSYVRILDDQERHQEALDYLERVVDLDGIDEPGLLYHTASNVLVSLGKIDEAIGYAQKAIEAGYEPALTHQIMATLFEHKGAKSEAAYHQMHAASILRPSDLPEALRCLNSAESLFPEDALIKGLSSISRAYGPEPGS